MKQWYVVRTKPRMEERAEWHLKNQGYTVYLPRYRRQIRHARRVETVLRPLFPNYMFIQLDLDAQNWHSINATSGVISLVPFPLSPKPLPSHIIDSIRARENDEGVISLFPMNLRKGDEVQVCNGAFADHRALLEEVCDDKRVILLLNMMGREVRVSTGLENLAKIS